MALQSLDFLVPRLKTAKVGDGIRNRPLEFRRKLDSVAPIAADSLGHIRTDAYSMRRGSAVMLPILTEISFTDFPHLRLLHESLPNNVSDSENLLNKEERFSYGNSTRSGHERNRRR